MIIHNPIFTGSLSLNGTNLSTSNLVTTGSNTFAGIQTVNSNLIVTGSITAQTLVVQTITSSVDFVTGSTRFGSVIDNTHQFTGSVGISGSLSGSSATFSSSTTANNYIATSTGNANVFNAASATTGWVQVAMNNTSGSAILGVEGNTGGTTTNGSLAYATVLRNYTNTALQIATNNIVRATITSGGSVLVSSTSSENSVFKLQVGDRGSDTRTLFAPNNGFALALANGASSLWYMGVNAQTSANGLQFYSNELGSAVMTMTTAGNVGIGTTSPQAFLHIAGQNGTNTLTLGTSNNYEIFITGSDSANIYHASPNQAIYLNTNGGPLYLGPSSASTLLTVTGSNVGIGTSTPTATLQVRGPNAVGTFFDAQNAGAGGAVFSRINAGSFPYNQYLFNNGYVGVGATSPLSKLEVNGTIKSTELDAPNRQTIIKSSGIAGTLSGTLTISVPTMSDGAGSIGYGGFSCEVYIAGYDAKYCHVWFSGYVNGGVSAAEVTILRSSGGWAANMIDNGAQGQTFIVDIPAASIVHPTARIIWNKGGSNNSAGTNGELITATWS